MSHVSFSELKIWKECPWKHKLVYLDKLKGFEGNEHTAFGTAIHSTYEKSKATSLKGRNPPQNVLQK